MDSQKTTHRARNGRSKFERLNNKMGYLFPFSKKWDVGSLFLAALPLIQPV